MPASYPFFILKHQERARQDLGAFDYTLSTRLPKKPRRKYTICLRPSWLTAAPISFAVSTHSSCQGTQNFCEKGWTHKKAGQNMISLIVIIVPSWYMRGGLQSHPQELSSVKRRRCSEKMLWEETFQGTYLLEDWDRENTHFNDTSEETFLILRSCCICFSIIRHV